MIRFVTFHTELSKGHLEDINHNKALIKKDFVLEKMIGFGRGVNYEKMIHMLFSSARLFNPECTCEVLTDLTTQFKLSEPEILVHRFSINPNTIMFSRLCSQIEYLKYLKGSDDVVLLDSDMLIQGQFNSLFQDYSFALGITIRDDPEMPINGGVFFISGTNRQRAIKILEKIRDVYVKRYADQSVWWGDQLALRDVIFNDSQQSNYDRLCHSPSTEGSDEIGFFPCELYNYSPPYSSMYRTFSRRRSSEVIIHFKGVRKKLMFLYWQAFLKPLSPTSIRSLSERFLVRLWIYVHIPSEIVSTVFRYLWDRTIKSRASNKANY